MQVSQNIVNENIVSSSYNQYTNNTYMAVPTSIVYAAQSTSATGTELAVQMAGYAAYAVSLGQYIETLSGSSSAITQNATALTAANAQLTAVVNIINSAVNDPSNALQNASSTVFTLCQQLLNGSYSEPLRYPDLGLGAMDVLNTQTNSYMTFDDASAPGSTQVTSILNPSTGAITTQEVNSYSAWNSAATTLLTSIATYFSTVNYTLVASTVSDPATMFAVTMGMAAIASSNPPITVTLQTGTDISSTTVLYGYSGGTLLDYFLGGMGGAGNTLYGGADSTAQFLAAYAESTLVGTGDTNPLSVISGVLNNDQTVSNTNPASANDAFSQYTQDANLVADVSNIATSGDASFYAGSATLSLWFDTMQRILKYGEAVIETPYNT